MLSVKASSETGLFTEWSDKVSQSHYFSKYINYDHHRLLQMFET